ncbi:MAG: hypothetical protein IT365_09670 [Candidatus Hydrogenedentes bacterium]|nr:hypothetical protein [Candidatus Hydrogenedentota bacterium]
MKQHHRLLLLGTLLVVVVAIAAFLGPYFIRSWREDQINARASHVYDAIRSAGNWKLIRPIPEGVEGFPAGTDFVVVIKGAELEDGIAVLLINNDATFWLKDEVFHTVNDEAKALLPDAPLAPSQITDAAVRAVAT